MCPHYFILFGSGYAGLGTGRLAGLEAANALLPRFIAHYNARFAKAPRCAHDAHRGLEFGPKQLLWITSEQHARTLSKSLSCQYHGREYLI